MNNILQTVFLFIRKWIWIFVLGLIGFFTFEVLSSFALVTGINVFFGIVMVFLSGPMLIAGVMGNDSGRGGFDVKLLQFLFISYPLVYIIGVISSISVLYLDPFEHQQTTAIVLASISGIHLVIAWSFFGVTLLQEKLERERR